MERGLKKEDLKNIPRMYPYHYVQIAGNSITHPNLQQKKIMKKYMTDEITERFPMGESTIYIYIYIYIYTQTLSASRIRHLVDFLNKVYMFKYRAFLLLDLLLYHS